MGETSSHLEPTRACDVVSVHVGVHHELHSQPQLPYQLGVPLGLLDDGVDQDGLLGVGVSQEVGVGGGLGVKQLSEYHPGDWCHSVSTLCSLHQQQSGCLTGEPDHIICCVDEPNQT